MKYVTVSYAIKYELDFAPNYKWLENNQCYNTKTGRFIKQTICGRSIGYVINSKFKSLKTLKKHLRKPTKIKLPF